jgi:hypothetical protein
VRAPLTIFQDRRLRPLGHPPGRDGTWPLEVPTRFCRGPSAFGSKSTFSISSGHQSTALQQSPLSDLIRTLSGPDTSSHAWRRSVTAVVTAIVRIIAAGRPSA